MKDYKKEAQTFIDAHASWFTDISDQVWGFAELSLKEFKSTELYCQKLRELGFAVTENLGGIRTSFCGAWGSGHPVIPAILRNEYEIAGMSGTVLMDGDPFSTVSYGNSSLPFSFTYALLARTRTAAGWKDSAMPALA